MVTFKLISPKAFAERLSGSRPLLYHLMGKDPAFPRPVRISQGRIAFVESEVDAYIRRRIAARDDGTAA